MFKKPLKNQSPTIGTWMLIYLNLRDAAQKNYSKHYSQLADELLAYATKLNEKETLPYDQKKSLTDKLSGLSSSSFLTKYNIDKKYFDNLISELDADSKQFKQLFTDTIIAKMNDLKDKHSEIHDSYQAVGKFKSDKLNPKKQSKTTTKQSNIELIVAPQSSSLETAHKVNEANLTTLANMMPSEANNILLLESYFTLLDYYSDLENYKNYLEYTHKILQFIEYSNLPETTKSDIIIHLSTELFHEYSSCINPIDFSNFTFGVSPDINFSGNVSDAANTDNDRDTVNEFFQLQSGLELLEESIAIDQNFPDLTDLAEVQSKYLLRIQLLIALAKIEYANNNYDNAYSFLTEANSKLREAMELSSYNEIDDPLSTCQLEISTGLDLIQFSKRVSMREKPSSSEHTQKENEENHPVKKQKR